MAKLDNFLALKNAVKLWLNRTDAATVSAIPSFISLAETDLEKVVNYPEYEELMSFKADKTTISPNGGIFLPSDYDEIKSLVINGEAVYKATNETFFQQKHTDKEKQDNRPSLIKVKLFTRVKNELLIHPVLKEGDEIKLVYFKQFEHMDSDGDSPVHLTASPECMLYLSLRHGALFLRDLEQAQFWEGKAQEAVVNLVGKIEATEQAGSSLIVPGG